MNAINKQLEQLYELLLELKAVAEKLVEYSGNQHYISKFDLLTKNLNKSFVFVKAAVEKDGNSILKKLFKKIYGDITTITQYKKPDSTIEVISFIESFWPQIEVAMQPEAFTERIYDRGSQFDFHLDIRGLLNSASSNIFIVEPYINEDILEITLKDIPKKVSVKILTNIHNSAQRGQFNKIAGMFRSRQTGGFESRECAEVHDRGIFIDENEGWVIGQSLKDAAKSKPTYLVRVHDPAKLKRIYLRLWGTSNKIV